MGPPYNYDALPTAAPITDEEYARRLQSQEESYPTYSTGTYSYSAYVPPPPCRQVIVRPRVVYRSPPVADPIVEIWILCCFLFFFFLFFFFIIMVSYYYGY